MPSLSSVLPDSQTDSKSEQNWRFFGRRKGRPLSAVLEAARAHILPRFGLEQNIRWPVFEPSIRAVELEIGFGDGGFLAAQAAQNPQKGFIGAEVFENGVAQACKHIEQLKLENVRLYPFDARKLLHQIPDAALDTVYLLFPDPWPKSRHAKRRFIQADTWQQFVRILKPSGQLLIASDNSAYIAYTLQTALVTGKCKPALVWQARQADHWLLPPTHWHTTRYEKKQNNHAERPAFLTFTKTI